MCVTGKMISFFSSTRTLGDIICTCSALLERRQSSFLRTMSSSTWMSSNLASLRPRNNGSAVGIMSVSSSVNTIVRRWDEWRDDMMKKWCHEVTIGWRTEGTNLRWTKNKETKRWWHDDAMNEKVMGWRSEGVKIGWMKERWDEEAMVRRWNEWSDDSTKLGWHEAAMAQRCDEEVMGWRVGATKNCWHERLMARRCMGWIKDRWWDEEVNAWSYDPWHELTVARRCDGWWQWGEWKNDRWSYDMMARRWNEWSDGNEGMIGRRVDGTDLRRHDGRWSDGM